MVDMVEGKSDKWGSSWVRNLDVCMKIELLKLCLETTLCLKTLVVLGDSFRHSFKWSTCPCYKFLLLATTSNLTNCIMHKRHFVLVIGLKLVECSDFWKHKKTKTHYPSLQPLNHFLPFNIHYWNTTPKSWNIKPYNDLNKRHQENASNQACHSQEKK